MELHDSSVRHLDSDLVDHLVIHVSPIHEMRVLALHLAAATTETRFIATARELYIEVAKHL